MTHAVHKIVADPEGVRGLIDSAALQRGDKTVWVTLENGEQLPIPVSLLVISDSDQYSITRSWQDLLASHKAPTAVHPVVEIDGTVLPVVEEAVQVDKQWVESGVVRVRKLKSEEEELVQASLMRQEVDIERVPKNELLNAVPDVRYEGETLVIPVVAEELVVEKRLVLKEEIRVSKKQVATPWEQSIPVHKETIIVERTGNEADIVDTKPK
jgi:uncharacterized protein (TIGR02271 family)